MNIADVILNPKKLNILEEIIFDTISTATNTIVKMFCKGLIFSFDFILLNNFIYIYNLLIFYGWLELQQPFYYSLVLTTVTGKCVAFSAYTCTVSFFGLKSFSNLSYTAATKSSIINSEP